MTSGIYAYWDNVNSYYVYVGKDGRIDKKIRHKYHSRPSRIDEQKINKVLQNNPNRYEYRIIMEGDYNDWQLNKMEKLCIKSFKTFKYDYPERNVFNFTKGGEGMSGFEYSEESKQKMVENHADFSGENNPRYRGDLDDDVLVDEYLNNKLSCKKIARKYNTNVMTVTYRLNNLDIDTSRDRTKNTTGYYRVFKNKNSTYKQGFTWVYYYYDENGKQKRVSSVDLKKLEVKVKEKGLPWRKL